MCVALEVTTGRQVCLDAQWPEQCSPAEISCLPLTSETPGLRKQNIRVAKNPEKGLEILQVVSLLWSKSEGWTSYLSLDPPGQDQDCCRERDRDRERCTAELLECVSNQKGRLATAGSSQGDEPRTQLVANASITLTCATLPTFAISPTGAETGRSWTIAHTGPCTVRPGVTRMRRCEHI